MTAIAGELSGMIQQRSDFRQPQNDDGKVSRYMDFTKFVSLLASKSLYFARADKLGDPFEGASPKGNVAETQRELSAIIPDESKIDRREAMRQTSTIKRLWTRCVFANCWHLNNYESAAMWQLYLKSDEGVAVQTSYKKLRDCVSRAKEDIYLGQIHYIDYETATINHDMIAPFMHKRKSFAHENEVRALIYKHPPIENGKMNLVQDVNPPGLVVAVDDLAELIEKVYVAPKSPAWFLEVVKSVVEKYGQSFQVEQSDLDKPPSY